MKRIVLLLLIITACHHPVSTPENQSKAPFKEALIRNDDTVILKTFINNQEIEVFCIADSILLFSQEGERTDTIPFDNYLYGFNNNMDLNQDGYNDLMIYESLNMHGQLHPRVFLSNKAGKLRYRPELSIFNLCYDTITKHVVSFYEGGVYSDFSKNSYTWENDSLRLIRGASLKFISPEKGSILTFYTGKDEKPYKTFNKDSEELWDTAVFEIIPVIKCSTSL